jgi:drug/metabolite transporter (DMT)-like permease
MEKKITSPVTVGLILSLILIVFSIVMYLTGLYTQTWGQYAGFVLLFAGIVWGIMNYGKEKNHEVTFGNLFAFGFKIAAVAACLVVLYSVLSGYIFPEVKGKFIDIARQKALSNPNANEEQVEKGIEMFAKNYNLFIIIGIVFWYLLIGIITSLIGAAITKKNPPSPFDQKA